VGILKERQKAEGNRQRVEGEEPRAFGRRDFLLLPFAFCLLPSAIRASRATRETPADAWPQFRGNPNLTGYSTSGVARNLRLLWSVDAGESVESSAAVVGGAVYVGTQRGELVSVNLGDGRERWRYNAGNPIGESSPAVAGGVVYVGDLSGVLHAVSADTGQKVWTFKTVGEIKSSPVVTGTRVIVGSYDTHLYCVSAAQGRLLWKLKTRGQVHSTAGVADGLAYVAGCDEILRAVRVATGREEFQVHSGAYTGASPALFEGNAFYGTFNNEVLGVNLVARKIGWRYQNRDRQFPYYSSAGFAGGRVVIGGRDKMVHSLDAWTGREFWSFGTQARVESSPALADGRVFVGSNDGRLYVLAFDDGRRLADFNLGAPVSASPAIASGRVVDGAQDGKLPWFGSSIDSRQSKRECLKETEAASNETRRLRFFTAVCTRVRLTGGFGRWRSEIILRARVVIHILPPPTQPRGSRPRLCSTVLRICSQKDRSRRSG
jgi:outer membrane protein assembly factor BamB